MAQGAAQLTHFGTAKSEVMTNCYVEIRTRIHKQSRGNFFIPAGIYLGKYLQLCHRSIVPWHTDPGFRASGTRSKSLPSHDTKVLIQQKFIAAWDVSTHILLGLLCSMRHVSSDLLRLTFGVKPVMNSSVLQLKQHKHSHRLHAWFGSISYKWVIQ